MIATATTDACCSVCGAPLQTVSVARTVSMGRINTIERGSYHACSVDRSHGQDEMTVSVSA